MEGDKVEHIEGIIGAPNSWEIREETGELVEIPIPNGRGAMVKMRKSEAIRLGLWKEPGAEKAQEKKPNKMRKLASNKEKVKDD